MMNAATAATAFSLAHPGSTFHAHEPTLPTMHPIIAFWTYGTPSPPLAMSVITEVGTLPKAPLAHHAAAAIAAPAIGSHLSRTCPDEVHRACARRAFVHPVNSGGH